ncbi:MAG: IclR family transcriptional regulator [Thermoflavifilum sp.]|nr:IclR family transcriptional regulator [Thermoflavifilum sp.]MCL6514702.1 IclR family transcriptional regulator [Alicyclobacillus sp.]
MQSIDRVAGILDCFSADVTDLTLGEIAERTNLPKPTVYRLLSAMRKHRWIEQDERTGMYRLGFRLVTLGAMVPGQMNLRQSALPVMTRLAESTKETVNLNVIDGNERVCVELVEGSHAIRHFVKLGTRNSLISGASGKVLLAYMSPVRRDEILRTIYARDTLDMTHLQQELEHIRQQGYAVTYGNRVPGACGISAPLFDRTGCLIAGLTVSGPIERIREREATIVAQLLEAAAEISARLGYIPVGVERG